MALVRTLKAASHVPVMMATSMMRPVALALPVLMATSLMRPVALALVCCATAWVAIVTELVPSMQTRIDFTRGGTKVFMCGLQISTNVPIAVPITATALPATTPQGHIPVHALKAQLTNMVMALTA